MRSSIRHVAVMVDGSAAAERALLEAAAIADEHEASLTVIAPVPHDRRTDGPAVRAVRRAAWNRTLDAAAEADLARARALLGERSRSRGTAPSRARRLGRPQRGRPARL